MHSFYNLRSIFLLIVLLNSSIQANSLSSKPESPKIIGAMKDVMWGGSLSTRFDIDTLSNKNHLYGLGPAEFLIGEILILDGKGYQSKVLSDTSMRVAGTMRLQAPFFGYANIQKWTAAPLPDSVVTLPQLEAYLDKTTKNRARPFFFRIIAMADSATIHVLNLPKGTKVSSPADAHRGEIEFALHGEKFELLGFFSTEHQSIFTHHDTFIHAHLITADRKQMGHLEGLSIRNGTGRIFLPD